MSLLIQEQQKEEKEIVLTENQKKVISDKYLKKDVNGKPTELAADLMRRVAKNVALAELLHHPTISKSDVLRNVKHRLINVDTGVGTTQLLLLHDALHHYDERNANFRVFLDNLYAISETPSGRAVVQPTEEKFFSLLSNFEFLPNSPTLMNAGRDLQQLSACYVLPIDDSIEGWMKTAMDTAIIHKSGGGTGFSGCRVRPFGDRVKSTHGVASGPLSVFNIINTVTQEVKQGGTRRGANMGILPYWHPNIMDFITYKRKPGQLENFNISVAIDDKFIQAAKNNQEYDLINPKTKQAVGKLNAKEVFDLICQCAWETGDPGMIMIERINNSTSNPTPAIGEIESTNPCGEQPLLPYEPCNLGSINVAKFVHGKQIDYPALGECVKTCIQFLDNVIDVNNYPLPEIEKISKGNRRIGLGIMGFAELLIQLEIPYNSDQALAVAEELMRYINEASLVASEEIASRRGTYPNYRDSIYDASGKYFRGKAAKPRNCARTTIAPTGTIGLAAGLQGAGIEPLFAIVYVRYNAKALDALKEGRKPNEGDVFYEVNPYFEKVAKENNYFGLRKEDLWQKIIDNHCSVSGVSEIPQNMQKMFTSAHDIIPEHHIRIQAAFQRYTDNAVSKTINLPNTATVADIARSYMLAYETGCKGITVYRDGSKSMQVLNLGTGKDEKKAEQKIETAVVEVSNGHSAAHVAVPIERRGPKATRDPLIAHKYEIETGYGPVHMTFVNDDHGMYQTFFNLSPIGTEISGMTAMLGILVSKFVQQGGDPEHLIKHLNSVKGDKPLGFGPNKVNSIPHAIAIAMRDHLDRFGQLKMAISTGNSSLTDFVPKANGAPNGSNGYALEGYAPTIESGTTSIKQPLPSWSKGKDGTIPNFMPGHPTIPMPGLSTAGTYSAENHCPKCFSMNTRIEAGCSEPTCYDCGYSKCG